MAKKSRQQALADVRAVTLDGMNRNEERREIADPDPNLLRDGIKAGQWPGFPRACMPPKCPITVLGMKEKTVFIISATGYLFEVSKWDLPTLELIFTPYVNYLYWAWPAFSAAKQDPETGEMVPPKVDRLARDKAASAIIAEAGRRGMFDPNENVRGRGGWTANGGFVWHGGKKIYFVEHSPAKGDKPATTELHSMAPGELDGCFYPQGNAILSPWSMPVEQEESPAHYILHHLKTWNWERPYLDPILMLGWIAVGFLGGALESRPIAFVMGGPGTGKSALQRYVRALYGSSVFATSNTTAAGIYQSIGHDSRPIAVDEFERKAGGVKETAIIEIARQAYSGDKGYRGGSDGSASEFQLNNAFFFTSILIPHLEQQDKTRMAIMQLNPLKDHGEKPVVKDEWGRKLLRQIMDNWQRFSRPEDGFLEKWRRILSDPQLKFDSRAIDTYGTLLACAEMLVGEGGMIDAGMLPDLITPGKLDRQHLIDTLEFATAAERKDQVPKWLDVIERVMGTIIDVYKGGERYSVGEVVRQVEDNVIQIVDGRRLLANQGLGLRQPGKPGRGYCLAIPKSDDRLNKLFQNTEFYSGGWTHALKLAPESVVPRNLERRYTNVDINRLTKDCMLVDLAGYDEWIGRKKDAE